MKFFQKLLVSPATIDLALAPNLNGFSKDSNKSNQDASDTNIDRFSEAGRHIKLGFNFIS